MSPARDQAGFSLVEVIIALAIVALFLSPLMGAVSQAARLEAAAAERSAWADEARSILDLSVAAPRAMRLAGQLADGTAYTLDVSVPAPGTALRPVPVTLYRLHLTIGPPDDPFTTYTTYALSGGAP